MVLFCLLVMGEYVVESGRKIKDSFDINTKKLFPMAKKYLWLFWFWLYHLFVRFLLKTILTATKDIGKNKTWLLNGSCFWSKGNEKINLWLEECSPMDVCLETWWTCKSHHEGLLVEAFQLTQANEGDNHPLQQKPYDSVIVSKQPLY